MRRLLVLPLLALVLSACGLSHTGSQGYLLGDGGITAIDPGQRGVPISLSGTTLEGKPFDLASTRGKVTVINIWGAWCGSCIEEGKYLAGASKQLGSKVDFVGIDVQDSSTKNPLAYQRGNGITYPSIYSPDATALLALDGEASPRSMPTTLILDRTGRVATTIDGPIPDTITLVEAVQDVMHGTNGA